MKFIEIATLIRLFKQPLRLGQQRTVNLISLATIYMIYLINQNRDYRHIVNRSITHRV